MRQSSTLLIACVILGLVASQVQQGDFTSSAYQAQTRQDKLDQLWEGISANTQSGSFPSALTIGGLFLESMSPSMWYVSDSVPAGRTKYVHSVGSSYTAQFTPTPGSPYTGFFQGADSIVSRISLAKQPDYSNPAASAAYNNFTPAVAFKFLIDGQPSTNIFSMFGVNGVHSFNPFDQDFNSHIPGPTGLQLNLIADKFSTGDDIVQFLGTSGAASYTQDGEQVANPVFPFMVTFRAPDNIKAMFTPNYTVDYKITLSQIPVGSVLFNVYATESPSNTCEQLIGQITTTSQITPSLFGDETLFFQHPDFHADLNLQPGWTNYTPVWNTFGSKNAQLNVAACPYANLF